MTCDKCGTPMVGNSTSSKVKGDKRQYYVCGGYLRKGKEYCPYVGWNKEKVEEIVANRMRIALMRLLMNDNLENELKQYYMDSNHHKIAQKVNLENEIDFLAKRIQLLEQDIQLGKSKSYHKDMLDEMQTDLSHKTEEHARLSANWVKFNMSEEVIAAIRYDIQTFLGLLDQEIMNPQLLHTMARKYISKLTVNRDTGNLYLTIQIAGEEAVLYEKTMVSDWQ